MVVVKKPNGKDLNKVLKRSHYLLPTIKDILQLPDLSRAKVFCTFNVKNGFWHIELDDVSSKLTTFNTSFRRYCWLQLPFGLSSALEESNGSNTRLLKVFWECCPYTMIFWSMVKVIPMRKHTNIMIESWKISCGVKNAL